MKRTLIFIFSVFSILHIYAQKPQLTVEYVDSTIKTHIEPPCSVFEAILEINELFPEYYTRYECFTDYSPLIMNGVKKDIITSIYLIIPQNEYSILIVLDIRTKDPKNQNNKQCWCLKKGQIGCEKIMPHKWEYRKIKHYIVLSIDILRKNN